MLEDSNVSRIISVRRAPCLFQPSHINGINNEKISKFRRVLPQFIAVGINNISLLVYGMTLGFPIIIIPAIQLGRNYRNNDLFLNREQVMSLSSISLICVPLGSILSGFYSEYIGKKRALQLVNIPIIISFLLYHFATNAEHLYLALGLSGLCCGLIETPVLIYIAETVESQYRGYLTASGSIFILLGIMFQYYISSIIHWRMIAAISTLFPVISIILLFFIPESHVWLISKNNLIGAIKSLKWLRGWVSENDIEIEFFEIYDRVMRKNDVKIVGLIDKKFFLIKYIKMFEFIIKKSFWYPFLLLIFMFFIGHFSGKTILQTYTVQIFHTLKAPLKKFEATMLLSLSDILGVLCCVVLLNFVGRRKLIFISTIGIAVCFSGAGIYAHFLYKIPGFAVDNIVNFAAKVPNNHIITTTNITNIFKILSENNLLNKLGKNNTDIRLEKNVSSVWNEIQENTSPTIIMENTSYKYLKSNYNILYQIENNNTEEIEFLELKQNNENSQMNKLLLYNNGGNSSNISNLSSETIKSLESLEQKITIPVPQQETNDKLWIPLVLLYGAAFFAHIGIKTVPWILIGEIFPHEIRSYVAGITCGTGFFFGFLANQFFLDMVRTLTISGVFFFYAGVAVYGAFMLYFILPETEKISLTEIELYFDESA